MNNKRTLVNLYKDIVLVTCLQIFCVTLFTNNSIKVVIQIHSFQFDRLIYQYSILALTTILTFLLEINSIVQNGTFFSISVE